MQKHTQTMIALAAAQVLCLAFGLWIQDRILIQSASWKHRALHGVREAVPAPGDTTTRSNRMSVEAMLKVMPQVRVVTLLWTGGLQLVSLYLVINHMRTDHSKTHEKSRLELMRQWKDLVRTRNSVIFGLASLAESRDRETGKHLERIALYSTRLASALRSDPRFSDLISAVFVKSIGISSVLHDIGKVGVPDAILLKPGQLTDEERRQMQKHTTIGSECLQQIERRLGSSNFLHMARQIALHHHERWDGSGYPCQLGGEDIPLVARVVALADMYDALSVKRVYKEAFPHERCVDIIRNEAGKHLDPAIVDVFLRIEPEFAEIARQFGDLDQSLPTGTESATPPLLLRKSIDDQDLMETVLEFEQTIDNALGNIPGAKWDAPRGRRSRGERHHV